MDGPIYKAVIGCEIGSIQPMPIEADLKIIYVHDPIDRRGSRNKHQVVSPRTSIFPVTAAEIRAVRYSRSRSKEFLTFIISASIRDFFLSGKP